MEFGAFLDFVAILAPQQQKSENQKILYSPVGEKKTTEFVFPPKESFGKSKVVWVDFVLKVGVKIC